MPRSQCPVTWIRLRRHKCLKSWSNIEDPVFLLLTGTPHASLSLALRTRNDVHSHHGSRMFLCASHHTHGHPCCVTDCCLVASVFLALFLSVCIYYPLLFSVHFFLDPDLNLFLHVVDVTLALRQSGPSAELTPLTGNVPKLPEDFHYSETSEIIFRDESSDKDAVPSYLFDAKLDDETIGKTLSSPLFTQEREEPADRRQAYHSYE